MTLNKDCFFSIVIHSFAIFRVETFSVIPRFAFEHSSEAKRSKRLDDLSSPSGLRRDRGAGGEEISHLLEHS